MNKYDAPSFPCKFAEIVCTEIQGFDANRATESKRIIASYKGRVDSLSDFLEIVTYFNDIQ